MHGPRTALRSTVKMPNAPPPGALHDANGGQVGDLEQWRLEHPVHVVELSAPPTPALLHVLHPAGTAQTLDCPRHRGLRAAHVTAYQDLPREADVLLRREAVHPVRPVHGVIAGPKTPCVVDRVLQDAVHTRAHAKGDRLPMGQPRDSERPIWRFHTVRHGPETQVLEPNSALYRGRF